MRRSPETSGSEPQRGVAFPSDGPARSTSAFARSVLGRAFGAVDPVGRRSVEAEADWRSGYLSHYRRLVEAGLASPAAAVDIARAGVDAVASGMRWVDEDGAEVALDQLLPARAGDAVPPGVRQVVGRAERVTALAVPYHGRLLTGGELDARLTAWVDDGVMEGAAAQSVRTVSDHPDWLALPGRTVVALGAGAEIGPTPTLLRWGATVAGVDLPRPELWQRVLDQAEQTAGTLLVPAAQGRAGVDKAGIDLLTELPELAAWVDALDGELVLGSYLYADGAANVRVSAAGDALATWLQQRRDVVQAYLATPTDVFAVPGGDVARSVAGYRASRRRWTTRAVRGLSAGKLLRRNYLPGADPGICDSLVAQQGPNYALAKRLQRWRATTERAAGQRVSLNVAPPTRTRSVLQNRALAAAYAGAHRFGVEVFEPSTTRVLMAALLVHDLCADRSTDSSTSADDQAHPWQAETVQGVHGGLWTGPFAPRSALGLAAVLGLGASRS